MTTSTLNFERLISRRAGAIDASGIRRIFELGASLKDPINLSIGQPDFPVPDQLKDAVTHAVSKNRNGYTLTQGAPDALRAVRTDLKRTLGWSADGTDGRQTMITSGTSGGLLLAFLAMLDEGDEAIIADPYFVVYPTFGPMTGGRIVTCDTYPDFRLTAARVAPLITDRTKIVLVNSPGNPSGVVLNESEMRDLAALCDERGVLLISDEIYDLFTYDDAREDHGCPTPARYSDNVLLIRGFGKSYGCTGWRLGYASGPSAIVEQMLKLQQYSFVCAPSIAQASIAAAYETDMSEQINAYQRKRDMVVQAFDGVTNVSTPGGAFYAFIEVPPGLGLTATEFVEQAIKRSVLVIPGSVFSTRDTHFRVSFAAPDERLARGLEILVDMMQPA